MAAAGQGVSDTGRFAALHLTSVVEDPRDRPSSVKLSPKRVSFGIRVVGDVRGGKPATFIINRLNLHT